MALNSARALACLALLATALTVTQAMTVAECKDSINSVRCNVKKLTYCERWVCTQNVNRKVRICVASADQSEYQAKKTVCDNEQIPVPQLTNCSVVADSVGYFYNKGWCDQSLSNTDLIATNVKATSDALEVIKGEKQQCVENQTPPSECVISDFSDVMTDILITVYGVPADEANAAAQAAECDRYPEKCNLSPSPSPTPPSPTL